MQVLLVWESTAAVQQYRKGDLTAMLRVIIKQKIVTARSMNWEAEFEILLYLNRGEIGMVVGRCGATRM